MSDPLPTPDQSPEGLARAVRTAYERFLVSGRRNPTPHPTHVYASAWRACERRMVLEMTHPELQQPFDTATLARFRRGDDRERDVVNDLRRIGREADPVFDVVGTQGWFNVRDRRGRQVVSGKVDGFLAVKDWRREFPIEVKSWAATTVERLEVFADVFDNPWTRSGGYQMLIYLYAHGLPIGFLVLDTGGLPKLLPVVLEQHLDRVEEFLTKAERAVDHALAGTLPDYLVGDAAECTRCSFYGTGCNPPLHSPDVAVFTDEELERGIQRLLEIRDVGKEYAALDKQLKDRLRGVEVGFCGPYAITGKWQRWTTTVLPEAVKKQYTVSDPKGRFSLTFSKPNPQAADPKPAPSITQQLQASVLERAGLLPLDIVEDRTPAQRAADGDAQEAHT